MLSEIVSKVNALVWSPLLVVLLLVSGLLFSCRTRFVQVRRFSLMMHSLFGEGRKGEGRKGGGSPDKAAKDKDKKDKKGISSFEAFCVALSGRVGTGNIVGVATAIAFGGPGAVFWMWVVAFFGASTAFVESTLAQIYKFPHKSGYRGGPFSFIEKGLGLHWLGVVFALVTVLACGMFLPTVQANGLAGAMTNVFPISTLAIGIAFAVILGLVVFGGMQRIARVASIITPLMAFGYVILSVVVLAFYVKDIPAILASIVTNAFGINPVCGGILGSTIAMGVKRGIFSNEAGQGSGAIVSASADVSHPAQQGLAQAFSVYIDTLLVCTATAIMILSAGTYNIIDSKTGEMLVENAPALGNNYVGFTQAAVDTVLSGFGSLFISIAMAFFAFSTVMAYYFYAESSIIFLFKDSSGGKEKIAVRLLQALMLAAVIFGSVRDADLIWQLGDIGVGLMAWFTVCSLLFLHPKAINALNEYEKTGVR